MSATGAGTGGLLRFITCGSVDDGKSTLIGRLLYETQLLYDDHVAALEADSRRWGTQGEALDFALLVDGLAAEREQGITIDVAYRFFATTRRKFIVADTPGHEQYTRNMVTGASTADLAVVLVDARKGVLRQTRRHSLIVQLLGLQHVVLAVNKLDLVDDPAAVFAAIEAEYREFGQRIGLPEVLAIPLSGLRGDNVVVRSPLLAWYAGPTLLEALERCVIDQARQAAFPLRLPVQGVLRPDAGFRGYTGLVAAGRMRPGDPVIVLPSGRRTRIARIVGQQADEPDWQEAAAGQSVTLTLTDDVDVSRGDVIAAPDAPPEVADQFECQMVWMGDEPMLPGRPYLMKIGSATVGCSVTALKHRLEIDTFERLAAATLGLNEIGLVTIALDRPLPFEPYAVNRELGGFIVIDRHSHHTVGAGLLRFALRRASNVHWQALDVDRSARAALLGQRPFAVWLTGLSGSGKSTLANALARRLHGTGRLTYVLDGDNVRHGLNRDLGFTDADRVENIRRVAEVARLMVDAGLIVITAFISPFRAERELARSRFAEGEFMEVHVDVPLELAEARDPKGLYAKARRGELPHFTGIDSPYEAPERPELRVDASSLPPEAAADQVIEELRRRELLGP
ncbi:MAG: adenylyl-sulfate kinase [Rubrivivax sp.]|nr:adenylyl-sulfate kinase [Rubrivivax sp.]